MKATQIFTAAIACVLLIHHLPTEFGHAYHGLIVAVVIDILLMIKGRLPK